MTTARRGTWIWSPRFRDHDEALPGRFILFRKEFDLAELPREPCLINVSADTRYRLFVNGTSVAFGPCKSYPSKWYYETVNVSAHLRVGKNILTARVLRFFADQIGSSSLTKSNLPGFLLWSNSDDTDIVSDTTWLTKEDASVRLRPRSDWNYLLGPPFMSLDEDFDGSLAQGDLQDSGADAIAWLPAVPAKVAVKMMPALEPWKLHPRPIPMLPEVTRAFHSAVQCDDNTQVERWNALLQREQELVIPPNTTTWVEMQTSELTTGFFELKMTTSSKATLEILYAESYEKDLGVESAPFPMPRTKGDRSDYRTGRLYGTIDRLVLPASTENSWSYEPFWFRTFRFVRLSITTTASPLSIHRIAYRETHYPLQHTTSISLPKDLEPIWKISLNTLKNCMHETYEDCPFYEQNQFAMDSRLQMLFTYCISRDDRLARKTIHEFHASRRDDGLLETNYPVAFRAISIPQFSLFWILMLHDHFLYFHDKALIKQYISTADGVLQHFDQLVNAQGLVGAFDAECWAFIDWVKEWHGKNGIRDMAVPLAYKRTGVATYNSLVYAYVLKHAADLCDVLGRRNTASEYRARAQSLNNAVNKHCFNGEFYLDGPGASEISQHPQIFAILSGAIVGPAAAELMHRTMITNMPQCSYALQHYVFRALELTDLYEEYFEQVMKPWHGMVADNLTTCAEDDVSFRSDCHGWSASPIYEVVAGLYGVRPRFGASHAPKWEILPRNRLLLGGQLQYETGLGQIKMEWDQGQDVNASMDSDSAMLQAISDAKGWQVVSK